MNTCYNSMILLNIGCIGSLAAVYFADLGVGFSELPFCPAQCTAHPYKLCHTKTNTVGVEGYAVGLVMLPCARKFSRY